MTGNRERDERGRLLPTGDASRKRVLAAISAAIAAGEPVTVSGIARTAHVNRDYIQKRPDLRDAIREHGAESLGPTRQVRLPPAVDAAIEPLLGDKPWGWYIRLAVVEKLARDTGRDPGELDGAGGQAQRRRNYSERETTGKQQGSKT